MSIIQCIACGNPVESTGENIVDYYCSMETFSVITCSHCGLRITEPKPPVDKLTDYYAPEKYISHNDGKGGLFLSVYQFIQRYNLKLKLRGISTYRAQKGTLLDIGCGNGAALSFFIRHGWHGIGVEPAPVARRLSILSGLEVYGEEFLSEATDSSFDLITMWHVLEHVYDVPERLRQVLRLVKSNGLVVVAVPNPDSYDAKHYGPYWAAWDVPRHLYHFSKKSFELLVTKTGFEIAAIQPMWFDSYYVALTSEKYKNSGYFGIIVALWIGFWSNLISGRNKQGTSSLIYYLKPVGLNG